MGTQLFDKAKIKVEYTPKVKFTEDAAALKPYADDADKLIKQIKAAKWDFVVSIDAKKKEVSRVTSVVYPQVRNGHQGESGHDWQWQLDTETAGKGSKVRLYLDDVKTTVKNTKNTATVKVGRDDYTLVECEITLTGEFTAGQKH